MRDRASDPGHLTLFNGGLYLVGRYYFRVTGVRQRRYSTNTRGGRR